MFQIPHNNVLELYCKTLQVLMGKKPLLMTIRLEEALEKRVEIEIQLKKSHLRDNYRWS